jgi:hypothetical protein
MGFPARQFRDGLGRPSYKIDKVMPVVTTQVSNLQAIGSIIEVEISPSASAMQAMQTAGIAAPSPIKISALIDTGASQSVIQCGLPQKLALFPVGTQLVNTPSSHNFPCDQYLLRLMFFPTAGLMVPVTFDAVFTEAPLKGQKIQCLLGRDFLANAVFTYIGPTNTFVLSL